MRYQGNIYRPPSEARSLIIQATIGCSHNKCTFCGMFKDKHFQMRHTQEIIEDIHSSREYYPRIKRIFLADGDALIIKTRELMKILHYIKTIIPECERVGIYASPKSVSIKSVEELVQLRQAGLKIAYMGLESGNDEVLENVCKGNSAEEIIEAGRKLKRSGMLLSVTLISGLGGKKLFREHAVDSAKAINKMNPDYLGLLTLMVEPNTKLYGEVASGQFELLTPKEVAIETLLLLQHLNCEGCVFRSNHASNYLPLRGILNQDKEDMIYELKEAIAGKIDFKSEYLRGL